MRNLFSTMSYGVIGLFLLATGIWLALDLVEGRAQILTERAQQAAQRSQIISQSFGGMLLSADYVLRDLSGTLSSADIRFPDPDPAHAARLQAQLQAKAATVPGVFGMTLFDRQCVFTATAHGARLGYQSDAQLCQARQQVLDDRLHTQYLPGEKSASQRPVIVLSRNLRSSTGEFLGGILAVVELAYAQQWLASFSVSEGEVITVVDTSATVLARMPPLPNAIGQRVTDVVLRQVLAGAAPVGSVVATSPYDGRERIVGMAKVADFPFVVVVGTDKNRALADWQRRAWQLAGGFAVLVALALLTARAHARGLQQQAELRASKGFVQSVLNSLASQIAVIDKDGVIVEVNDAWRRFSQANSTQPGTAAARTDVGVNYLDMCAGGPEPTTDGAMQARDGILAVLQGRLPSFSLEYPCHSPQEERWFVMTSTPLHGSQKGAVVVHSNITERHQVEDKVRNLAYYDSLTQLPNRRMLTERLAFFMASSKRSGLHGALMLIDLDNFKPLNDSGGHALGDLLLVEVAQRLVACVREVDTVARLGGDEFVLLLAGLDMDAGASTAQALAVAEKIRQALARPYRLTEPAEPAPSTVIEYHCSASIGVTLFTDADASQQVILKRADAAMYQAKAAGRNQVRHA